MVSSVFSSSVNRMSQSGADTGEDAGDASPPPALKRC